MTPVAAVPLVVLAAAIGICAWVHRDAAANRDAGTPVVLQVGNLRIESPEAWTVGCLVVFVVFVPLYLAARNASFTGRP
jgi:hypothetical protein